MLWMLTFLNFLKQNNFWSLLIFVLEIKKRRFDLLRLLTKGYYFRIILFYLVINIKNVFCIVFLTIASLFFSLFDFHIVIFFKLWHKKIKSAWFTFFYNPRTLINLNPYCYLQSANIRSTVSFLFGYFVLNQLQNQVF